MKIRKWAIILVVVLLLTLLSTGRLFARTENSIMHLSGGRAGYSTAIISDPARIPLLVIKPEDDTRLDDFTFEIRLTNAYWDFDAFSQVEIDNYGTIDSAGVFTPDTSMRGYLTNAQNPVGVRYTMQAGNRAGSVLVTLEPGYPVTNYEALYIPLFVEITGNPASLELFDMYSGSLSTEGILIFASGSAGDTTTQVRPGDVVDFSQTLILPDLSIRELADRALVSGALTLRAPAGFRWIDLDQIEIEARNSSGIVINARDYATEGSNAVTNASVMRLHLTMDNNPLDLRTLILKNLKLEAVPNNNDYGPLSITLSGCNMEQETIKVANRVRLDYTFTAESLTLPKIAAGVYPADPTEESLRTLKLTLAETSSGRWRANGRTTFTLPQGVTARAVLINTTNFSTGLPRDTLIQRLDANAFALNSQDGGVWTLSANGLTVQNVSTVSGRLAMLELTFYITAEESFRGPVQVTAGGSGLNSEVSAAIAEVFGKAAAGTVELTIGRMEMKVGGETVTMDVAPYIENNYTMVPVSFVARAMGLPADSVQWDGDARTVTIQTGSRKAVLTIGSNEIVIDGITMEMPQAPVIRDGRTFLPFRILGEQVLQVAVDWNGETRTAMFY
ncbi:MAG: copper amine oxidase N-terminal domain-containing protein [Clostridiales bacterium]|nr:copper amine oxidase N-terminal domain-containing protein [Clostridiales bacterium]